MPKFSQINQIKISLFIVLVSLFVIYYIETTIEPQKIAISDINFLDINKPVKIEGKMKNQQLLPQGHLIFRLKQDSSTIQAIMFSINKTIPSNKIIAYGKLKSYNRSLQLQVNKIKKLN